MLVSQEQFAAYVRIYNMACKSGDYAVALEAMDTAQDHARALSDAVKRVLEVQSVSTTK